MPGNTGGVGSPGVVRRTTRKPASVRRAEITEAAAAQFARSGLAGTSLETIAAHVDVSHPRVVQMFGSKRALFLEALSAAYQRLTDEFDEAAATATAQPVPLTVLGDVYRRLLARDRTVGLMILQGYAASGDESVRAEAARHHSDVERRITALTGANSFEIRTFMATGLIITVSAALGLRGQRKDDAWAAALLNSVSGRVD